MQLLLDSEYLHLIFIPLLASISILISSFFIGIHLTFTSSSILIHFIRFALSVIVFIWVFSRFFPFHSISYQNTFCLILILIIFQIFIFISSIFIIGFFTPLTFSFSSFIFHFTTLLQSSTLFFFIWPYTKIIKLIFSSDIFILFCFSCLQTLFSSAIKVFSFFSPFTFWQADPYPF